MSLWSDLLSEAQRHARGDALSALHRLEVAVMTGQTNGLDAPLLDCAERIGQAEQKVASGSEIVRMSELVTLSQFGAGSIGTAIAGIYDAPDAARTLEAMFVSKFLTELMLQRRAYPNLFPSDLLRNHAVERSGLNDPGARPVLAAIVDRATESYARITGFDAGKAHPELAVLTIYEKKLLSKRLRRLSVDPCIHGAIDLGVWDRFSTAISLRLRKRPSP